MPATDKTGEQRIEVLGEIDSSYHSQRTHDAQILESIINTVRQYLEMKGAPPGIYKITVSRQIKGGSSNQGPENVTVNPTQSGHNLELKVQPGNNTTRRAVYISPPEGTDVQKLFVLLRGTNEAEDEDIEVQEKNEDKEENHTDDWKVPFLGVNDPETKERIIAAISSEGSSSPEVYQQLMEAELFGELPPPHNLGKTLSSMANRGYIRKEGEGKEARYFPPSSLAEEAEKEPEPEESIPIKFGEEFQSAINALLSRANPAILLREKIERNENKIKGLEEALQRQQEKVERLKQAFNSKELEDAKEALAILEEIQNRVKE